MSKNNINEALHKIEILKIKTVSGNEISKAVSDAFDIIFKETCSKPYLQHCEPNFCIFKSNNMCDYASEFSRLKAIVKQPIE